jgi:hypothetical protein
LDLNIGWSCKVYEWRGSKEIGRSDGARRGVISMGVVIGWSGEL